MISLKKYLDSANAETIAGDNESDASGMLHAALSAYRSALLEMGRASIQACPALGDELKQSLSAIEERVCRSFTPAVAAESEVAVRDRLAVWGGQTARHFDHKAREVKELLLVLARTAESVGERDNTCAAQMSRITDGLQQIATLDDVTEIRASLEASATELKASIHRMTTEGKAVVDQLRSEVSSYRARLEEAEYIASCDALTGLGSRLWTEGQLEDRIARRAEFCAILLDVDGFKKVNDQHGHLVGDELLKQFSTELRSACRSSDVIGRWGGDEFLVLMDGDLSTATAQAERLRRWICGNYTLDTRNGPLRLAVSASLGLAAYEPGETMKDLLDRADASMYRTKHAARR